LAFDKPLIEKEKEKKKKKKRKREKKKKKKRKKKKEKLSWLAAWMSQAGGTPWTVVEQRDGVRSEKEATG
jgi:hypothetical protein